MVKLACKLASIKLLFDEIVGSRNPPSSSLKRLSIINELRITRISFELFNSMGALSVVFSKEVLDLKVKASPFNLPLITKEYVLSASNKS